MKIKTIEQVTAIEQTINCCKKEVWIESPYGERLILTDPVDRLRGLSRLLEDDRNEFEFFANDAGDRVRIGRLLYSMGM